MALLLVHGKGRRMVGIVALIRRLKRLTVNVCLLLVSTIFALILAEILLGVTKAIPSTDQSQASRVLDHYPDYYKLKKDVKDISYSGLPISSNMYGFRDQTMTLQKQQNVCRIAVLGDSWGFGWGVPEELSIVSRLEDRLQDLYGRDRVELLNFSIPGFNLHHYRVVLEQEVLRFSPDYLLILLHINDIDYDEGFSLEEMARASGPIRRLWPGRQWAFRNLNVYRFAFAYVVQPLAIWLQLPNKDVVDYFGRKYADDDPAFERYRSDARDIMAVLEAEQLPVSICLLPIPLARTTTNQLQAINDRVASVFTEYGIAMIQIFESIRGVRKDQIILHAYDRHPNALGSELLSQEIYEKLVGDPYFGANFIQNCILM